MGVLDWYEQKLQEINNLIGPTLMVIALAFVIFAYVSFRSWKKAMIAGIGGAIVLAVVTKISGLSELVENEFSSGQPQQPGVVLVVDHASVDPRTAGGRPDHPKA
ncbi:hypothetical protein [Actinomadura sp. 3N407]|uniref:hypothetical protein n=1 Tax=Actinomadura sp. 3N407 TaxID=3457423 RepID=UPI003FCD1854